MRSCRLTAMAAVNPWRVAMVCLPPLAAACACACPGSYTHPRLNRSPCRTLDAPAPAIAAGCAVPRWRRHLATFMASGSSVKCCWPSGQRSSWVPKLYVPPHTAHKQGHVHGVTGVQCHGLTWVTSSCSALCTGSSGECGGWVLTAMGFHTSSTLIGISTMMLRHLQRVVQHMRPDHEPVQSCATIRSPAATVRPAGCLPFAY